MEAPHLVTGIQGWKLTDDKKHALIGFEQDGKELVLAIAENEILNLINSLVDATAAFPLPKGFAAKHVQALSPEWFEFGRTDTEGQYSLSVFFPSKGHLTVLMNRSMTQRLFESIGQELRGALTDQPPVGPRN